MSENKGGIFNSVMNLLEQDYRGVNVSEFEGLMLYK